MLNIEKILAEAYTDNIKEKRGDFMDILKILE